MRKPPLKRFPFLYGGRKETLTDTEVRDLFSNPFIVEEKLDGTLVLKEYGSLLLMLEDMLVKHSVFYDSLPSRYILVDVLELKSGLRLNREDRIIISTETGYSLPPYWDAHDSMTMYIARKALDTWIEDCQSGESTMGNEPAEGFVIKSEMYMNLGGKYSRLDLRDVERYDRTIKNKIIGWRERE